MNRLSESATRQLTNGMISNFGFLRLGLLFVSIVRTDPFPFPIDPFPVSIFPWAGFPKTFFPIPT
jgi:hypothetical protein